MISFLNRSNTFKSNLTPFRSIKYLDRTFVSALFLLFPLFFTSFTSSSSFWFCIGPTQTALSSIWKFTVVTSETMVLAPRVNNKISIYLCPIVAIVKLALNRIFPVTTQMTKTVLLLLMLLRQELMGMAELPIIFTLTMTWRSTSARIIQIRKIYLLLVRH